jgi:hypothetical protein
MARWVAVRADSPPASQPLRAPARSGLQRPQQVLWTTSRLAARREILVVMSSDLVFSPCQAVSPGDGEVHLLLLQDSAEQLLLPAWSSLDRLVQACGEQQPWVSLRLCDLDGVRVSTGAVAVLLDALEPWPAA